MIRKSRVEMGVVAPEIRKNNFEKFISGYTKDEAVEEAKRCLNCKEPKCSKACPAGNSIPSFIHAVSEEDFKAAFEIISEKSVMPEICSTVCPHENQCEGSCIQGIKGDSIAIGSIERFVSEWGYENGLADLKKPLSNGKKVCCIGAGPASFACAEVLLKEGFSVTLYEKENYAGGVLSWGIPSYRLDRSAIKRKTDLLISLGAEFVFGCEVKDLEKYRNEYDAVFIGTGACISNAMNIPGEDSADVFSSYEFLSKVNLSEVNEKGQREFPSCGRRVAVVGGGNAAMDAARDAVRLPQVEKVVILYRRTEDEMPACKEELAHAKEEGIEFMTLTNPVEFKCENGRLKSAICAVMELGEPDASGRRRPVDTGERKEIEIDTAVLALGFSNDPEIGNANGGLDTDRWGCFITDEGGRCSLDHVYAGGDAVTGAATVVKAMKAGMKAAESIISDLK